jgi:hypothetical protein
MLMGDVFCDVCGLCVVIKMSLDFALTQFYRLAVDDLIIMYDAYHFYGKLKPKGKTINEFVEVCW